MLCAKLYFPLNFVFLLFYTHHQDENTGSFPCGRSKIFPYHPHRDSYHKRTFPFLHHIHNMSTNRTDYPCSMLSPTIILPLFSLYVNILSFDFFCRLCYYLLEVITLKMRLLGILLVVCVFLSSCGKKPDDSIEPPVTETETPVVETENVSEFYKGVVNETRPIAVMIDNDDENARPQTGLEKAYLVYEIVVEGGATRFMALFKDHSVEKVGPIRSSRHYFLDYVLENDAVYAHCGWSPKAQQDISSLKIKNINGVIGTDAKAFWRDNTYNSTWHNLYSSGEVLKNFAKSKNYSLNTTNQLLSFNKEEVEAEGNDAKSLKLKYSYHYTTSYEYNEEKGVYLKYINGYPHKMQSGETLDCENIIAYKVKNFPLNDGENKGRQDLSNIGSGEGFLFSGGKCIKIKWSKASRNAKTVYTYENGEEVVLNPGRTFINIVPENGNITY